MITRIEISGFKTFTDFAVDLAPFTVIAGANASGKSNLLDALQLVKEVASAQHTSGLRTRGGLFEAVTKYSSSDRVDRIKLAVELLIPKSFKGKEVVSLDFNRFRYEVHLSFEAGSNEDIDSFKISKEVLSTIPFSDDKWATTYLSSRQVESALIIDHGNPQKIIDSFSKSSVDEKGDYIFGSFAGNIYNSSISEIRSDDDKHIQAVRKSLSSIKLTNLLDPNHFSNFSLDAGSSTLRSDILSYLLRLNQSEGDLFSLSRRVKKIIKDIDSIDLLHDKFNRTAVTVTDLMGREYLASSLSEGTLRTISLAALVNGVSSDQVVLLEEPENGIDPRGLNELLNLMLELSTVYNSDDSDYRQLICTTHSPTLLQEALIRQKDRNTVRVLLATKVTYLVTLDGQRRNLSTTRMNEVVTTAHTDKDVEPLSRYTLSQAIDYLNRLKLPDSLQKALPDA